MAVSISIIFTVLMMVFEPVLIRVFGLGEMMSGALIGGTVDSTGAVTVAGTALGETAQTVAVLVKSIQSILIGFIALAVAAYIMAHGIGLIDSLDFGAGAYYYADIPEFAKYTDGGAYHSPVPMWTLIVLFLIWGAIVYKAWKWMDRKIEI